MTSQTPGLTGGIRPQVASLLCPPPKDGVPSATIMLTARGARPVEALAPGDRIVTRDAGMVRLDAAQSGIVTLPAVSIAPGALGQMRDRGELILPACQHVLLRDWRAFALAGREQALLPVSALIDGEFIRDLGPCRMMLHQLQFDAPHIVYADGVELAAARVRDAAPRLA